MKKQQMIKKIYDVVAASGLTSHKFKDDDWRMVAEVRDTINRYFLNIGEPVSCYYSHVFGYTNNGMAKEYEVCLENEQGELLGKGIITACAAGTVENVWSSYDICVSFWAE
jgi:hypothetical protein